MLYITTKYQVMSYFLILLVLHIILKGLLGFRRLVLEICTKTNRCPT